MKPLFGAAMTTRMGTAIGKGLERVMMDAVGGINGIRKTYRNNPDGTTTMLSTRGGFPEFTTSAPSPFTITVSFETTSMYGPDLVHTFTISRSFSTAQIYTFSVFNRTAISGIDFDGMPFTDANFSNGVTIIDGTITVPAGVTSFTVTVHPLINPSNPGSVFYEIGFDTTGTFGAGTGTITNP